MKRHYLLAFLLLLVVLPLSLVQACGPDFKPDVFVRNLAPDDPEAFAKGKLGVLLPTYPRGELTVAFRYLNGGVLSSEEQKAYAPSIEYPSYSEKKYPRSSVEMTPADWEKIAAKQKADRENYISPNHKWNIERNKHALPIPWVVKRDNAGYPVEEGSCAGNSVDVAIQTMESRAKTWGEQSPELLNWILGQDIVFANCTKGGNADPMDAPANAPVLLKADRMYQKAAAKFQRKDMAGAQVIFEEIWKDTSSPWSGLAHYLVGRCLTQEAYQKTQPAGSPYNFDRPLMQQAIVVLQQPLKENEQGITNDDMRDLLEYAQIRAEPLKRLGELSRGLAGPKEDPRYDTHFFDLGWYLNSELDGKPLRQDVSLEAFKTEEDRAKEDSSNYEYRITPPSEEMKARVFSKTYNDTKELRSSAELVDWLLTFQSPAKEAKEHAFAEWKSTNKVYWLVAAISKATAKDAEASSLIQAASTLPADSVATDTVMFHRIRLLSAMGQQQQARALLDKSASRAAEAKKSDSSANLDRALRMNAALTLDEALQFAPRKMLEDRSQQDDALQNCQRVMKNPHRSYDCKKQMGKMQLSDDAARMMNYDMSLGTLSAAANSRALPSELSESVAMMTWVRAVLLHNDAVAARVFLRLPAKLQKQAGAGTGFRPLMALLRNPGLRPYLDAGTQRSFSYDFVDDYADNWWCSDWHTSWEPDHWTYAPDAFLNFTTSPLFLSAKQRAEGRKEVVSIQKGDSSEIALGNMVLEYAQQHPNDADLPEALYLTLRVIRYGCNHDAWGESDADKLRAKKIEDIAKSVRKILRQRYLNNPWTKKATPFL